MVAATALKIKQVQSGSHYVKSVKKTKSRNKIVELVRVKSASKVATLSDRAREELVLKYQIKARKMAFSILRRWHARLDLQEVHSIVDLSLCEAVRRYNPAKGASFITFLFYHLRGNLIRGVAAAARLTAVPLTDLDTSGSDADGRHEWCRVSAAEAADAVSSRENMQPDEIIIRKELLQVSLEACKCLDSLEKEVLFRIFLQEEQLLDVAHSLGYSRCHISRVKRKALETLQSNLTGRIGEPLPAVEPVVVAESRRVEFAANRRLVTRRRPRAGSERIQERGLRRVVRLVVDNSKQRACA